MPPTSFHFSKAGTSANSKKDAYLMAGEERYVGHERSVLTSGDPERTPLRSLYIECNDEMIYTSLENFFQAVNKVLWNHADPDSFIRKTVGIQALFDLAKALLPEAIEARDLRTAQFVGKLKPAGNINFADSFFHASGAGRTTIRKTLEYAMKLKTLTGEAPDYEEYRRLLG